MATRRVEKPLPARMLDLVVGYWVSQLVFVAAKLAIADHLAGGAKTVRQLAKATQTEPHALHRMLRALASVGVFAERPGGRFALTPLASTLRSDRPDSLRDFVLMMVEGYNWKAWEHFHSAVATGEMVFPRVHGMKVFEYLAAHPEDAEVFSRSMASLSGTENPAVVAAYDFSKIGTLVDVGGAHGHLLAAVLERHPQMHGILFDRPNVIEHARVAPFLRQPKLAGRVRFVAGDVFESVPSGADACVMKYVLHDWTDDQCVTILNNCRAAMPKRGRVLVVDTVIESGNRPQWGKLLDITMLVVTGGRERTREEFTRLFERAGLRVKRVIPTKCPLSIVEGVPR
jgi:O-methyltransferase/methyltransferase family protein